MVPWYLAFITYYRSFSPRRFDSTPIGGDFVTIGAPRIIRSGPGVVVIVVVVAAALSFAEVGV